MDSKVLLTVIVFLAYHLTEAVVHVCGPKECSNIGQRCPEKRDKVCVNGMCRTCFCADPAQCYMQGRRDTECDCSNSTLGGKYCNCTECETCDDVFGFSKRCKRYAADFSCKYIRIKWSLATECMHANESFAQCKGLCLMNNGCKMLSWKAHPEPTCSWYEPTSLVVNNIECPSENQGYWYTCFRKCEFC